LGKGGGRTSNLIGSSAAHVGLRAFLIRLERAGVPVSRPREERRSSADVGLENSYPSFLVTREPLLQLLRSGPTTTVPEFLSRV